MTVIPPRVASLGQDRPHADGAQGGDVRSGHAELGQHPNHVRLHGAQLGAGSLQVAELIGAAAQQPRREDTTTPSVSVSAAKMRPQIVAQPFLPPQPGTAPRPSP